MADVSKLRRGQGKGAPPAPATAVETVTTQPPREKAEATRPLQVVVPVSVFEEFGLQAAREFGAVKGSKQALFLKIWRQYRDSMIS
jgi:hypothetical protein